MRKVLFASYGGFDFPMITPVFPLLRSKGYDFAIKNRYDFAPSARQLKGLKVFSPPDISDKLLSADAIESAVNTFLDTRSIRDLIPVWRGQAPGLKYLLGWSDYYFEFALETLHSYEPDLVVLSLGEAETAIVRRVCELTSVKCACLVPQRYEFKFRENFTAHESVTYMVAGEYGKERLTRRGIKPERILVTGNPRFDRLSASARRDAVRAEGRSKKTILYTVQGVPYDRRLFQLLRRYARSRRNVRIVVRPHPNLPRRSSLRYVRHMIAEPVSVAFGGTLDELLRTSDVLITTWSLTILEALIAGLPVICWKSDFFPEETPFASRGDAMPVHTYAELELALDRMLFDEDFRRTWLAQHRDCHVPYTGVLDGTAASRVADAIEALVEGGTR